MYYIISEPPKFCPNCGHSAGNGWKDKYNQDDFFAHASHSCAAGCGAHFQYVEEEKIIETAKDTGGDL